MNNFFRALIAGYGAKKLGGGCLGTIVVFILIWVALGQCSFTSREVPPPETYPAKHRVMLQYQNTMPPKENVVMEQCHNVFFITQQYRQVSDLNTNFA
jgi:hypothetical protein